MRTWDDNRASINQLWPQCKWSDEERKLWHDDLHSLDQPMLYDAIRNVKRNHDTLYPQLKWVLEAYRELSASRKRATKPPAPAGERLRVSVNEEEDRKLTAEFIELIDLSRPSDWPMVEAKVLDVGLPKMSNSSARRVLNYARLRLLGEGQVMSRITQSGDVVPFSPKESA